MQYIAYLIVLYLLPLGLFAQYKFEQSRLFDEDDGFEVSRISMIRKGPDGFLWMATYEGLCRFDGSQFYYYRHDPADPTSIIDNRVRDVIVTGREVWAATAIGLSVRDLETGDFNNFRLGPGGKVDNYPANRISEVFSLFQDREGQIWVGSGHYGIFRYFPAKDEFRPYPFTTRVNHSLPVDEERLSAIHTICESRYNDSLVYAGTSQGLLEINKITNVVRWHAFAAERALPETINEFRRIYFHTDGLLYIGSETEGIRIFDPREQHLFVPTPESGPGASLLDNGVNRFHYKDRDEIWITNTHGLLVYNTVQHRITFAKENRFREGIYYGVDYIDDRDRVWHAAQNGLQCFDPLMQQFRVHSFAELNRGTWGLAHYVKKDPVRQEITVFPRDADGLFHLDLPTGTWSKTPFPRPTGKGVTKLTGATGMESDPWGNCTLASEHGLYTFYPSTRRVQPFAGPESWTGESFANILWDSRGQFWAVPADGGLWRWNPHRKKLVNIGSGLTKNSPDREVQVRHLTEDSQGNIWFSRDGGIGVYLWTQDTIYNFLFDRVPDNPFRSVNSIAEDNKGRIWFSAEENFIGYADAHAPENGISRKIDLSRFAGFAGFAGADGIRGLQADQEGNIWGYTAESLVKLDASNLFITAYNCKYGKKDLEIFSFHILPRWRICLWRAE